MEEIHNTQIEHDTIEPLKNVKKKSDTSGIKAQAANNDDFKTEKSKEPKPLPE